MRLRHYAFLGALLVLTAVRLWIAAGWDVRAEEAYFWLCGQRMDLAFFDGPWGTALLARAGTEMIGDGAFGLRFAFPLLAAVCTVAVGRLASKSIDDAAGWWAMGLLNVLPEFNASAVSVNPIMPAFTFALMGAACVSSGRTTVSDWIRSGIAFGLALQFSLMPIFALFATVAGCLSIRITRRDRAVRVGIVLAVAIGFLALLPWVIWNARNQWPVLAIGTLQTFTTFSFDAWLSSLTTAAAMISWPVILLCVAGFAFLIDQSRQHRSLRAPVITMAVCIGLWIYGAAIGFPSGFLLLFTFALVLGPTSWLAAAWPRPLALAALAVFVLGGVYPQVARIQTGPAPYPWPQIQSELNAAATLAANETGKSVFIIAQNSDLAASLAWHAGLSRNNHPAEVFRLETQNLADQFGLWPSYDDFVETSEIPDPDFQEVRAVNPHVGKSALYLTDERMDDLPQAITAAFESVQLVATLQSAGIPPLYLYFCRNYLTLPL